MVVAVIVTLLASVLWAITNHIDKYLLCKVKGKTNSIKALLVFSSLFAGILLSPIWLVICKFNVDVNFSSLLAAFSASILYILATYFYFKALEKNDASIIVMMFQLIPVFSFILELVFFNEMLKSNEIIGALIIIGSTIFISFDTNSNKKENKKLALILMTISSFLYALYFFMFDVSMKWGSYNKTVFWYQIGLLLTGLVLICIKDYRNSLVEIIKRNKISFLGLNCVNEVLNLSANILVNFANVLIPLALVNSLNGFQSAFVFIIGFIGTLVYPRLFDENINKKAIIQKIFCIILGIIGLIIMMI